MPYISAQAVREKRNVLKKMFPDYKLSVNTRNQSTICVTILSGPLDLLKNCDTRTNLGGYEMLNHYYLVENNMDFSEKAVLLSKIKNVLCNEQEELVYDGDYGSVPNYYIRISIGSYDKPYVVTK